MLKKCIRVKHMFLNSDNCLIFNMRTTASQFHRVKFRNCIFFKYIFLSFLQGFLLSHDIYIPSSYLTFKFRSFCITICSTLSAVHCLQYTICSTLSAVHYLQYTICSTLSAVHYLQYTICITLSAVHYRSTLSALHYRSTLSAVHYCSALSAAHYQQYNICRLELTKQLNLAQSVTVKPL